ncbi:phenylalanine--tRNA ligase subunit alpha [Actinokineospora diospyrosa]|uniref:phenylalanine--tRNA ligase n=1 Tax=Actinokineospora diospyrosa TaxID=103728 RepID=A0ABT1IPE7_9PSEU|nr:phenylalanine--tRNA ligase subunit alpha [Actinokineospora diospyrosa]MCP2274368.1 phenylalanyl-tRNA synthetase, alpha subunit [Actinokineospora diospyrosa]
MSDSLSGQLDDLRATLLGELAAAADRAAVEAVRRRFLGRRGLITRRSAEVDFGALTAPERARIGALFSALRTFAGEQLDTAADRFTETADRWTTGIDPTLPGLRAIPGRLHQVSAIEMLLEDIFSSMGFTVDPGFEVETEFANFDSVNIDADHPARDTQDTFWLEDGRLLRTQTSAGQVRHLRRHGAPTRAVFPGRCFRKEETDASHETTFHQCEGLVVGPDANVATLVGVLKAVLAEVFGRTVTVRLRPGHFPFVEPGFELDIHCLICDGAGCAVCKRSGWLELIPCGLVHPAVLVAGGVDPERHNGFAFGIGTTRLAMMRFGVPDVRLFASGDIRVATDRPSLL